MAGTWVMAPAEYAPKGQTGAIYQKCWEYDLAHGVISIGWDLGEAPESEEHLDWLWENYADPAWSDQGRKMLAHFWFGVEDGDIVIARAGVLKFVCLGEFVKEPWYDADASGLTWGCSFRKVLWEKPEERYSPIRFAQRTIYPLDAKRAALFGI